MRLSHVHAERYLSLRDVDLDFSALNRMALDDADPQVRLAAIQSTPGK